jgi:transcriptional repressor NrdR
MLCPFCRDKDTSVVDSRPTEDGTAIRRRRVCGCERKERFTTFERVQFRELTVVKNNGRKVPFDRDKIAKSIMISLRKRPIDSEGIEKFISKIVRNLEGLGENEIPTSTIGKFIMDGLSNLDQVAYVRFASVYRNFKEAKDFEQFIGNLNVYKSE